jgi:ribosomal protein L16 Arg81 hydroxylase
MSESSQHSNDLMQRAHSELTVNGFARRLEECWERQPFFFGKVVANSLSHEFDQAVLAGVIAGSHALLARTEVIRDGQRIQWTALGTSDGIRTALESGLSVLVRRFDFDHEGTAALAHALAVLVSRPVFATLFMTHRVGATFPAHYDAAEVFAVQLCGIKRWSLFGRINPPPVSDADVRPVHTALEAATRCEQLVPGDLLYVPRGTIHMVDAISTPAMHISFGVRAAVTPDRTG